MKLYSRVDFLNESHLDEKVMSDKVIDAALLSAGISRDIVEVDHDDDTNMLIIDLPTDKVTPEQAEKFSNLMKTNLFHKATKVDRDCIRIILADNDETLNEVNVPMKDAKISVSDAQAVVDKAESIATKKDDLISQLKRLIHLAKKKNKDYIRLTDTDAKIMTTFKN